MKFTGLLCTVAASLLIQNASFVAAQGVTRSTVTVTGAETVTRITGGNPYPTTGKSSTKTTSKPFSSSSSTYTKPTTKPTTSTAYTTTTQCVLAPWAQCGGLTYKGCIDCPKGYKCTVVDPYYWQCAPSY